MAMETGTGLTCLAFQGQILPKIVDNPEITTFSLWPYGYLAFVPIGFIVGSTIGHDDIVTFPSDTAGISPVGGL